MIVEQMIVEQMIVEQSNFEQFTPTRLNKGSFPNFGGQ
jgi:hypothetical protein